MGVLVGGNQRGKRFQIVGLVLGGMVQNRQPVDDLGDVLQVNVVVDRPRRQ